MEDILRKGFTIEAQMPLDIILGRPEDFNVRSESSAAGSLFVTFDKFSGITHTSCSGSIVIGPDCTLESGYLVLDPLEMEQIDAQPGALLLMLVKSDRIVLLGSSPPASRLGELHASATPLEPRDVVLNSLAVYLNSYF